MNPQWIDLSVVLAINEQQIAEHGGGTGHSRFGDDRERFGAPSKRFLIDNFSFISDNVISS
jgi:hypothetical protein